MSDYLYSSTPQPHGILSSAIESIYLNSPPGVQEFDGEWGSLAVSQSHYSGFRPYETEHHLMIVIGGPVLYFRDNDLLVGGDSVEATQSIYKRWLLDGVIDWDEDLSGPFTVLLIDKSEKTLDVVTDLMAFIPVYACKKAQSLYLGTHVDALATASGETGRFDPVSLAHFVVNDVVTYPYTAYQNIQQLAPASHTTFVNPAETLTVKSYWLPEEANPYANVQEAAEALRLGLEGYV